MARAYGNLGNVYLQKGESQRTIVFYEKMMRALSGIANAAENTGDWLRTMIVKS